MVQALLKFTQGSNSATGGYGLIGTLSDGTLNIANDDNTDVTSWSIELLKQVPGSSVVAGVLASASSSVPAATLTPDTWGTYRVKLTVNDADGNTDVDIRNFTIPTPKRGIILPPYQKLPDPLPVTGEGLPGEKPDEMNFGGQAYGWMGSTTGAKLLHQVLLEIDDIVSLPDLDAGTDGFVPVLSVEEFAEPIDVVGVGNVAYVLCSAYSSAADSLIYGQFTGYNPDSNGAISNTKVSSSDVLLVGAAYDGSQYVWVAAISGSNGQVRRFTPSSGTFSMTTSVAASLARGITYGGNYIWYIDAANLVRIDPTSPGTQVNASNMSGTPSLRAVAYDADTANYGDSQPRVWVADTALPGVQRIEPTTPIRDGALALANSVPLCIAVGGGFVWVAAEDTGGNVAKLYRISPNTVLLNSSDDDIDSVVDIAGGGDVYDVIYDAVTAHVYVLARDSGGDAVVIKVNPSTLAVVSSVVAEAGVSVSSGGPPPRMAIFKNDLWVPLMGYGVVRIDLAAFTVLADLAPYRQLVFEIPKNRYKDISADYELVASDHGFILHIDVSSGDVDITLPDDLHAGFWVQLRVVEEGNTVTVLEGGTSTLESLDAAVTMETRNKVALLEHRKDGNWYAVGLE